MGKFNFDDSTFTVVNVLKQNGQIYFNNNAGSKLYIEQKDALEEAERRARTCSKDYKYVVVKVTPVAEVEVSESPVKITYL